MAQALPEWDDLPWDDRDSDPGNAPQQSAARSQLPSWDELPDEPPQAETPLATGVREAAHSAIPAAAGFAGAGLATAGLAALTGAPLGPVGMIAGGVAGFLGASMLTEKAQEAGLEAVGLDDSVQRAINAQENPKSAFVGGMAPAMVGMGPVSGAKLLQRGGAAVMGGGFEAINEAFQDNGYDPAKIAIAAAGMAALPKANRLGEALEGMGTRAASKFIPGRPNVPVDPAMDQARADVKEGRSPNVARGGVTEQPAPVETGETTGNPQSAPTRDRGNKGVYAKAKKFFGRDQDMLTQGDMDPATKQALTPEESWLHTSGPRVPRSEMANPGEDLPINTGIAEAAKPAAADPVVDAGFPPEQSDYSIDPNRPAAQVSQDMGPAPLTLSQPEGAQAAIAASKARAPVLSEDGLIEASRAQRAAVSKVKSTGTGDLSAPEPKYSLDPDRPVSKTEAIAAAAKEAHPEPSPGQVEAGNYSKGHERFAGKPISLENEAGSIRRSKPGYEPAWEVEMPYHYGYARGTIAADSTPKKNQGIDIAFDPEGGPNHYVIDQKNAETGKFDEHKVFAHTTTPERARELYNAGFSDNRGPERLGAITPATEDELKSWFAKPGKKTKPYSKDFEEGLPKPEAAPVAEAPDETPAVTPKVVTATVKSLRAREMHKAADAIEQLPAGEQPLAASRALRELARLDGGVTSTKPVKDVEIARIPGARDNLKFKMGDVEVEAKTIADKEKKLAAYEGVKAVFEKHAPPEGEESNVDLRARAARIAGDAREHLANYNPQRKTPAEFLLARAAKRVLNKKLSPAEFSATEKLLRSGDPEAIETVRRGNIDADIANKRRPTVEQAEAKAASPEVQEEPTPVHDTAEFEQVKSAEDLPVETGKTLDLSKPEDQEKAADALASNTSEPKKNWKEINAEADAERAANRARLKALREGGAAPLEGKTGAKFTKHEMLKKADAAEERARLTKLDLKKKGLPKSMFDKLLDDEPGPKSLGAGATAEGSNITQTVKGYFDHQDRKSSLAWEPTSAGGEYARSLDDDFHQMKNNESRRTVELLKWGKEVEKDGIDDKMAARMDNARERGMIHTLDPKEQALYNREIAPILDDNAWVREEIKKLDPTKAGQDTDENHLMRITKGSTPEYNILKSNQDADPVANRMNGVSTRRTGTLLDRRFVALENDATGARDVISINKDGFTIHRDGNSQRVKDPSFEFEQNGAYKVGNDSYTMKQAYKDEIEQHARFENGKKVQYYHDIRMSAGIANKQLHDMLDHLQLLKKHREQIKQYGLGSNIPSNIAEHPEWEKTNLSNFEGWKVDPQIAHVMDDFAQPGFDAKGLDTLRGLSQAVTKTIFWLPIAHINNVGAHWFVGRGWDWLKPPEYYHLVKEGYQAMKSVVTQDGLQKAISDHNGGTISPSIISQDFVKKFAEGFGHEVERNPSKWDPIAKKFGLGPSDLVKGVYGASSRVMWAVNDIFLTHAIIANQRKGMTLQQSVIQAERFIPNYRLAASLFGEGSANRIMSQLLGDNLFSAFGRYHQGVINAYANDIKDVVKGNGAAKIDAVGHFMALGLLGLMVYPALDKAAQLISGNNKASQQRRGPLAIPTHLKAIARGEEDFASAARSTITLPPLLTTAIRPFLGGKDWNGKNIIEPGDLRNAAGGSLPAAAKVVSQGTDYLARGLVSPYSTLSNVLHKKEGAAAGLRDQVLDQKTPSAAMSKYLANVPKRSQQEAISRHKKPPGLIEGLVDKAVGFK